MYSDEASDCTPLSLKSLILLWQALLDVELAVSYACDEGTPFGLRELEHCTLLVFGIFNQDDAIGLQINYYAISSITEATSSKSILFLRYALHESSPVANGGTLSVIQVNFRIFVIFA
jgi:hypothetical protein